ncbi:hypothetical protein ACN28S_19580 [Cystobacter fuscus]
MRAEATSAAAIAAASASRPWQMCRLIITSLASSAWRRLPRRMKPARLCRTATSDSAKRPASIR